MQAIVAHDELLIVISTIVATAHARSCSHVAPRDGKSDYAERLSERACGLAAQQSRECDRKSGSVSSPESLSRWILHRRGWRWCSRGAPFDGLRIASLEASTKMCVG